MAQFDRELEDLGRSIQDIIDRAVNSRDFQKLNQTITQTVNRVVDAGSDAIHRAADPSRAAESSGKKLPALYGSTNKMATKGALLSVGGGILTFTGAMSLLTSAALGALVRLPIYTGPLVLLAAGIAVLAGGVGVLRRIKRFKTYKKTLGRNTQCALNKLARSVGKDVKFVRRDVRRMIDKGLFLEGHLDHEQTTLITSDETYQYYEQSRLEMEQRKKLEAAEQAKQAASAVSPQVQEVLNKGNAFIAEIRRCNDAIPGEAVSEKIDRMEDIVRRIFERAQSHPEIVPDLKKLMDYYLPMTVKLLNAYADMDAQPVQGETIRASKLEIEKSLDTLNLAFEKLLDELFADTALDISSDITVLNTLLAQEGLTEDDLTKMKK